MQKNAYHYLFQEETLYRVAESDPALPIRKPELLGLAIDTVSSEPKPVMTSSTTGLPQLTNPVWPTLNHKVVILTDEELIPSKLIFLDKVLKSIGLSLELVDLLTLADSDISDLRFVLDANRVHHVISFGISFTTINLAIHTDPYQPLHLFGSTFLLADPLYVLETDQNLKRKLWSVLQKTFLNT